jgi:hypothetical protein
MPTLITCEKCGQEVPTDSVCAGVIGGRIAQMYCQYCYEELYEEGGQFTIIPEEARRIATEHLESEGGGATKVRGCFGFVLPVLLLGLIAGLALLLWLS